MFYPVEISFRKPYTFILKYLETFGDTCHFHDFQTKSNIGKKASLVDSHNEKSTLV